MSFWKRVLILVFSRMTGTDLVTSEEIVIQMCQDSEPTLDSVSLLIDSCSRNDLERRKMIGLVYEQMHLESVRSAPSHLLN